MITLRRGIVIGLCAALPAAAAPAAGAASVKGSWAGSYTIVKGGSGTVDITMTINRLKVGRRSGTLENPGTPCHGVIRLKARRDGGYVFRYRERGDTSQCTGDDRVFVELIDANTLRWRGRSPDGRVVGKGRLTRT